MTHCTLDSQKKSSSTVPPSPFVPSAPQEEPGAFVDVWRLVAMFSTKVLTRKKAQNFVPSVAPPSAPLPLSNNACAKFSSSKSWHQCPRGTLPGRSCPQPYRGPNVAVSTRNTVSKWNPRTHLTLTSPGQRCERGQAVL